MNSFSYLPLDMLLTLSNLHHTLLTYGWW